MSNGDESDDAITPESIEERLDAVEADLEEAGTEADLDAVEETLDAIEADVEAGIPEAEDDEEGPREELTARIEDLRGDLEDRRGPYAEDVAADLGTAESTIVDTRWTDAGAADVAAAVDAFLEDAGDALDESFEAGGEEADALAAAVATVRDSVEDAGLDADADAGTIADLLEAAADLASGLEDAEEWSDLTVVEQLDARGFYDVVSPENRKDFPPEWAAIKAHERRYLETGDSEAAEMVVTALETFESDFMEENALESLKRMGAPEAYDAMIERAQKRNKPPIEILGKIGDDRALDTLLEFVEGEADPALQKVTLRAIGEIGSEEATQAVADRLVAEDDEVRSNAARALGLIGDTRAIDPLADVLEDDDADEVRASAAWALNQIGTQRALEAVGEYADDRSYIVQAEAEKAA